MSIENSPEISPYLELTYDAVIITTTDDRIVYVNDSICEIFGSTKDTFLNTNIRNHLPLDSSDNFSLNIKIGNIERNIVYRLRQKEINGKIFNIYSIKDLTKQRLLETNLNGILESAPDGIIMVDKLGKIVLVNSQIENLFLYNRSELMNSSIEMLIPDRYQGVHVNHRTSFTANPVRRPMGLNKELVGKKKDGIEFPVEVSLSPLVLNDDEQYVIAAVRDISERKRIEHHFYGILESAPDGIVMVNSIGKIVLVNSQVEKLFLYDRSELINQPIEILIPDRYRTIHVKHRDGYLHNPTTRPMGLNKELVGKRKDGTELPVEVSLSPMKNIQTGDEEMNVIAIIRDITVKKMYENQIIESREQAVKASSAKSEFLANVSHEIRTPMNGIVGFTEILLKTTTLTEEQISYINSIKQCTHSLLHIITNILDVSKIEKSTLVLNEKVCNFTHLINTIRDDVVALILEKPSIKMTFNISVPDNMFVMIDENRYGQIVFNLVNNAIKFTNEGFIAIECGLATRNEDKDNENNKDNKDNEDTYRVKFTISDSGIGIDDSKKEFLFKLFSQIDTSSIKRYPGIGVGLVICKSLVELMKGEINYQSTYGKGSTFWFEVPMKKMEPIEDSIIQSSSTSAKPRKKILVAEDNQINLFIVRKILTNLDCEVDSAFDGREALKKVVYPNSYDLIFMDIQMPNMDGYEATRILRTKGFRNPIIALTASSFPEDVQKSLSAGMNDHISKPINTEIIDNVLKKWLK